MMYYLLMFAVFLLVMQFAFALLPLVLPVILIFWLFSIFKKPNVRVYTHTYTFDSQSKNSPFQGPSGAHFNELPRRKPLKDSIDAEYTEVPEYDINKNED